MAKRKRKTYLKRSKYRVRNWSDYNQSLKQRGDLFIWFNKDSRKAWYHKGKRKPGGKIIYSDTAIERFLTVRLVYKLAMRQTEGFLSGIGNQFKINLAIPDYTGSGTN